MTQSAPAPEVHFRRSRATDAGVILDITRAAVRKLAPVPYSPEVVQSWTANRTAAYYRAPCASGKIWIAEFRGRPVGYGQGRPGEILRLFVDGDVAGLGIGRGLMERAMAQTVTADTRRVRIVATLSAVPFYQKWGFTEVGRGTFPRREGLPVIEITHMEKIVSAATVGGQGG